MTGQEPTTANPYQPLLDDMARRQQEWFASLCRTGMPPADALAQTNREFAYVRNRLTKAATDWLWRQPLPPITVSELS